MKCLVIILMLIINFPLFSYCKSNEDNACLNFKESIKLDNSEINIKIKDITSDKNTNKYLLLNKVNSLIIKKLDKNNALIWETKIDAIGVNILQNSENEIYITTYYNKDLNLEINNKKIIIKSNNTNALLILKLNTQTGSLINYLNISTNYGVLPTTAKFKENKLYIAGYYGGKSEFLEKKGYEDAFLLILDENLKKIYSKSIIRKGFIAIDSIKIGNESIYLKTNEKKFYKIGKKTKKIEEILKGANVKFFEIDKNENIYAITYNNILKKFDNTQKLLVTNNLKDFDYVVTPSKIKVKKTGLFIEYFAKIEYRNNIIISKYDLNLKNIWHNAILGASYFNGVFKIINKKLYLFGNYSGDLKLSDEINFYSLKASNFLFLFEIH